MKSIIRADLDTSPLLLKSAKLGDAFNKLIECQKNAKKENLGSLIEEIDTQLSQVKSLIREENMKKVKKTLLNLGTKFTRLQIMDISEKSGIQEEELIIDVISDMIKNKEIYAEYFKESKSVAFDQQANIDEIDKLMESYKDWEKKEIRKK